MECRGDQTPPAEDEDKDEEEGEEGCLAAVSLAAGSTSPHKHDARKKGGKSRDVARGPSPAESHLTFRSCCFTGKQESPRGV